jgi:hypothetical protein
MEECKLCTQNNGELEMLDILGYILLGITVIFGVWLVSTKRLNNNKNNIQETKNETSRSKEEQSCIDSWMYRNDGMYSR